MSAKTLEMKALALQLFAEGQTYAAIGLAIGKSRQYAQQLVRPSPAILHLLKRRAKGKCEHCTMALLRRGEAHVHHLDKGITNDLDDLERIVLLCRHCHALANKVLEPHKFLHALQQTRSAEMEKRFDEILAAHVKQ